MTLDPERLLNWEIPTGRQDVTWRDTVLYGLGVGLGADPMDEAQLRYVHEDGLRALPTMSTVLASPGFWMSDPATGIDHTMVVHGEQEILMHKPLPPEGTYTSTSRVVEIVDKGPAKGALVIQERILRDADTGDILCTLLQTNFCRGDGGCGGSSERKTPARASSVPERTPDHMVEMKTSPQAALVYRLNGDFNALHAIPHAARAAGYEMPLLHGLCSFGIAGHAVLAACCDYKADRLRAFACRFSAPVFPGETLVTEIWEDGSHVAFRSTVPERGITALSNGSAEISA